MKFTIGNLSPAAVIPPASDPYFQYVSLLMGFNGTNGQTTFTDDSPIAQAVSVFGAAQVDTAVKKFGTGSLKCTIAGTDYVQVPDNAAFDMGNGDLTIEFWWCPTLSTGNNYITGQGDAGGFGWDGAAIETNAFEWVQRDLPGVAETANSFNFVAGTWYYLAIERAATIARLYRDGVMVKKVTVGTTALTNATGPWYVGLCWPTAGTISHIDELRVTKGVARYNNDAGYAVPTAAFPRGGPPWFLTGPTASGNTWVGQVLTVAETDNAVSRAYQWKRNGSAISGATASTYTLVSGDIGATITCTITLTNTYGAATATSNGLGPITATNPLAAVRGSRYLYVNNSSTGVITLPAGSVAGDRIVVYAGHGYGISGIAPSGFTSLDNSTGSNYNGAVYTKVLSSGDITTGSVTVSFAGSYYGVVVAVTFVGGLTGVRVTTPLRDGSGATTRTVTTSSAPVAGDLVLYFGSARMNGAVTCNQGSTLQAGTPAAEGSGAAFFGTTTGGAITAIFSYAGSSSGDYQAIVVLQP